MPQPVTLETSRLYLRQWQDADYEPFAQINTDPVVSEYMKIMSRQESDELADHHRRFIAEHSWGFWALEEKATGSFIGYAGITKTGPDMPLPPFIETGWKLAHSTWGKGYATEAAREAHRFAFEDLKLPEIYAFVALGNIASVKVTERLAMQPLPVVFDLPFMPRDSPHRDHRLFRLTLAMWQQAQK